MMGPYCKTSNLVVAGSVSASLQQLDVHVGEVVQQPRRALNDALHPGAEAGAERPVVQLQGGGGHLRIDEGKGRRGNLRVKGRRGNLRGKGRRGNLRGRGGEAT